METTIISPTTYEFVVMCLHRCIVGQVCTQNASLRVHVSQIHAGTSCTLELVTCWNWLHSGTGYMLEQVATTFPSRFPTTSTTRMETKRFAFYPDMTRARLNVRARTCTQIRAFGAYPFSSLMMKSWASAAFAAAMICSSETPGLPNKNRKQTAAIS